MRRFLPVPSVVLDRWLEMSCSILSEMSPGGTENAEENPLQLQSRLQSLSHLAFFIDHHTGLVCALSPSC